MAMKRQRTEQELGFLAVAATGAVFMAERLPRDLVMMVSAVSREHRDHLKEGKREVGNMYLQDVVQSLTNMEAMTHTAASLGLEWPVDGLCEAATRWGPVEV